MDYREYKKADDMYGDCRLHFMLDSKDKSFEKMNIENLEKMQELLSAVGVNLDVTGKDLVISILPSVYHQRKSRGAGRRYKCARNDDGIVCFSDVVYMMQTMRDQDIADKIGMPIATYRRHKKAMKESSYYQTLDLNRLNDKAYLDQQEGNYMY